MTSLSLKLFLKYARYRYMAYRIYLRIKMGKNKRDKFLQENRIDEIDFLPERPYPMDCGAMAIPRKGTRDFHMLFIQREEEVKQHLSLKENETFTDVGANVGAYSLLIAKDFKHKGVRVIAIEAHPGNYKALLRNIQINGLTNVTAINKAVADHRGFINLYERSHDGSRIDSELYSLDNTTIMDKEHYNVLYTDGKALQLECDTLDNMLVNYRTDVMKMDIEGAEALALTGAENTLKKLRKIVVEIHGGNMPIVEQILRENDFDIKIMKVSNMPYLIGSKN